MHTAIIIIICFVVVFFFLQILVKLCNLTFQNNFKAMHIAP